MRKMERVPGIFKRQWDISITMGILNGVVISTLNISKPRIGNYLVYSHEQKPFAVYVTCFFSTPSFQQNCTVYAQIPRVSTSQLLPHLSKEEGVVDETTEEILRGSRVGHGGNVE